MTELNSNSYPPSPASLFSSIARQEDSKALFLYYWHICAPGQPEPLDEYHFDAHIDRRHRFDFAWLDQMIAVEVNGNAWSVSGGGRHGKDADLEKLNLAVSMGWRVFQFSPVMLNKDPYGCVSFVRNALSPQP